MSLNTPRLIFQPPAWHKHTHTRNAGAAGEKNAKGKGKSAGGGDAPATTKKPGPGELIKWSLRCIIRSSAWHTMSTPTADASCVDKHQACHKWASRDPSECALNPRYMSVWCRLSCNRCWCESCEFFFHGNARHWKRKHVQSWLLHLFPLSFSMWCGNCGIIYNLWWCRTLKHAQSLLLHCFCSHFSLSVSMWWSKNRCENTCIFS